MDARKRISTVVKYGFFTASDVMHTPETVRSDEALLPYTVTARLSIYHIFDTISNKS
jgi:hypothetical protein